MILALLLGLLTADSVEGHSPARWISVLRARELLEGRTPWTWNQLQEARSRVADAHFAQPLPPTWLESMYSSYLQYYPLLLITFLILIVMAALRLWRSQRWTTSLILATGSIVLWLLLLWPVKPDGRQFLVIKVSGTSLRQGNGVSYPPVVYQGNPVQLAEGVEGNVLAERNNGWVQVQLLRGVQGWVPRDSAYISKNSLLP